MEIGGRCEWIGVWTMVIEFESGGKCGEREM